MRVNGKEIAGVPDVPPPAVKKRLKTTEKRSLSSALKNVPALNPGYQPMQILERSSETSLAANSDFSPLGLFQLFITEAHLALIAIHTNLNAATKRAQDVYQEEQKSDDDRSEYSEEEAEGKEQFEGREGNDGPKKQRTSRPWYDTTADEIGVFIGILLLQGEAKLGSTKNYWNCQTDRGWVPAIHSAMSQVR